MDCAPLIVASQASGRLARSALPDAPVQAETPAPARTWRPATATLLRRLAARLDGHAAWELTTGR